MLSEDLENKMHKLVLKNEKGEQYRQQQKKKKEEEWEKKKSRADRRILRSKVTHLVNQQGQPPCKEFEDDVV